MQITITHALSLSSVALAYMGDAVHSAYVRRRLITEHDFKSGELTRRASRYVCARSQAAMMESVRPLLSEQENEVAKRAENTRTNNKPKNADRAQYRLSTAFEALLGFLYLTGQNTRLDEILEKTFKEDLIR